MKMRLSRILHLLIPQDFDRKFYRNTIVYK